MGLPAKPFSLERHFSLETLLVSLLPESLCLPGLQPGREVLVWKPGPVIGRLWDPRGHFTSPNLGILLAKVGTILAPSFPGLLRGLNKIMK